MPTTNFYTINLTSFVMIDDNIYLYIFSFKHLRYNKQIYTWTGHLCHSYSKKIILTHCYNHLMNLMIKLYALKNPLEDDASEWYYFSTSLSTVESITRCKTSSPRPLHHQYRKLTELLTTLKSQVMTLSSSKAWYSSLSLTQLKCRCLIPLSALSTCTVSSCGCWEEQVHLKRT